jgi:hypothetical protein
MPVEKPRQEQYLEYSVLDPPLAAWVICNIIGSPLEFRLKANARTQLCFNTGYSYPIFVDILREHLRGSATIARYFAKQHPELNFCTSPEEVALNARILIMADGTLDRTCYHLEEVKGVVFM